VIFFRYALRNLLARVRVNTLTLVCISLFVMAISLAMTVFISLKRHVADSAPPENVLVLARGPDIEMRSELDRAVAANVIALPGVRLAAREQVSAFTIKKDRRQFSFPVTIRGIDEASIAAHPLKVIKGRAPAEGTLEVMVGDTLQWFYPHLKVGTELSLPGGTAPIVGVYVGRGSNDIVTPRAALALHLKREFISSVTLVAESAERVPDLVSSINKNKALNVTAVQTVAMLARMAGVPKVQRIVMVMTLLLGLVAIIAIVTTMNSAVAVRLPELAALAAIGIRRQKLASMIAIESMLLALTGALVGAGIAELLRRNSDMLPPSIIPNQVLLVFDAIVPLISIGIGTLAGLLGSFVPALTVRRLNVLETLR
jgi:putative ABC transport system permease protein